MQDKIDAKNMMIVLAFGVITMCAVGAVFSIADRKAKNLQKGNGR